MDERPEAAHAAADQVRFPDGEGAAPWGGLIWQPKTLPVKETDWLADGPKLPIEFARHSGEDRITLVVMQDGPAVPVHWCKLPCDTLVEATNALRVGLPIR